MRRPRFTLAMMLGIVAVVGVSLAAFRAATDEGAAVVLNGVVLILTSATIEARFSQGGRSAWWFGFALFGWVYLFLSSNFNHNQVLGPEWLLVQASEFWLQQPNGTDATMLSEQRLLICDHLTSLVVAFAGGVTVWWLANRRQGESKWNELRETITPSS